MPGTMHVRIWDVEHGSCAMLWHTESQSLAMIDSGHNSSENWRPSTYLKSIPRTSIEYLFITNADRDHMSDLNGLWEEGISVKSLCRNDTISTADLRRIKERDAGNAPLGADIERYLAIHGWSGPSTHPFNDYMGGVKLQTFCHRYPAFDTTNNLSLVVGFEYKGFKILFPGDMERPGWLALIQRPDFRAYVRNLTALVAPHHGRHSGYCAELFELCSPSCVVFSDKQIAHGTQEGMDTVYRNHCTEKGVQTTGAKTRWVLTTRNDGWIHFAASDTEFTVSLESGG